jgi:hypothetical protein
VGKGCPKVFRVSLEEVGGTQRPEVLETSPSLLSRRRAGSWRSHSPPTTRLRFHGDRGPRPPPAPAPSSARSRSSGALPRGSVGEESGPSARAAAVRVWVVRSHWPPPPVAKPEVVSAQGRGAALRWWRAGPSRVSALRGLQTAGLAALRGWGPQGRSCFVLALRRLSDAKLKCLQGLLALTSWTFPCSFYFLLLNLKKEEKINKDPVFPFFSFCTPPFPRHWRGIPHLKFPLLLCVLAQCASGASTRVVYSRQFLSIYLSIYICLFIHDIGV